MLIKFIEETTVQDKTKRHYPKGCVVEMAADACRHFVSRKRAVFMDGPKKTKPAPVVDAPVVDAVEEVAEAVAKKSRKRRK